MLKAWSITTTVRNPERLRDFLVALQPLENCVWDNASQEKYQKLLIKNRLYGFGNQQYYNGLPQNIINIINDTYSEIDKHTINEIIRIKDYTEFAMRGRQSLNPLTKFGFAMVDDGVLKITELGRKLIANEKDTGDVFLKSFIKWQIPNPANDDFANNEDYGIVPFVATLKLIDEVNRIEQERGNRPVGISKREFSLFVPTLVKYTDISRYANEIIKLRDLQRGKTKQERKVIRDNYRQRFAISFLGTEKQSKIDKLLTNTKDYGDNTIRYFRLTKFIRIRGNGFFVDLEPNRRTEIQSLFDDKFYKPKSFANRNDYLAYMSDDNIPALPWRTHEKLSGIAADVYGKVVALQNTLNINPEVAKDTDAMSDDELDLYVSELRTLRKDLQEKENHIGSQPVASISEYIEQLENIYSSENRALMLEYLSVMGLHAFNDAREIKPNYPVGDDNEPTSTAPGGMADIECFYDSFNMICEVTMLNGRDQWFNEGQPVMRHLRDFENSHENAYCMFIAPTIHADSAETFWVANTVGYKGNRQKIAPITIRQFVKLLRTLRQIRESNKCFSHNSLRDLISEIVNSAKAINNSDNWVINTQSIIDAWSTSLLGH